jgi:DNA-binding beta-propeller fold protein YncE
MKTTRAIFGVLKITLGLTGRICTSSLVPLLSLLTLAGLGLLITGAEQTKAASIYWTDEVDSRPILGNIWRANVDGSGKVRLAYGQNNCFGIALNVSNGRMYWTDEDGGDIRSANLDGTGQRVLCAGLNQPVGIALDVARGKMYWTEVGDIRSANLDGTGKTTLLSGLGRPLGVALDLSDGKMYWVDFNLNDIERANLDGSGHQLVIATQVLPEEVALDLAQGKIYWTTVGSISSDIGTISRVNLDGSGQQLLLQGLSRPVGIALDIAGGKMYWADSHYDIQGQGDISVANLDGTGRQTILTGLNVPDRIALQLQALPPRLTLVSYGTNVTLSWPTNYAGFDYSGYILQSTTNLGSSAVWDTNSPAPVVVNGQNTVTNPITGTQQFYRLSQ